MWPFLKLGLTESSPYIILGHMLSHLKGSSCIIEHDRDSDWPMSRFYRPMRKPQQVASMRLAAEGTGTEYKHEHIV